MAESDAVANRQTAGSLREQEAVTKVQPSDGERESETEIERESRKGVDRSGRRRKQEETFKLCAVKNVFDGTSSAITFYFCLHTRGDKSLKTQKKPRRNSHTRVSVRAAACANEQTRAHTNKHSGVRVCEAAACVYFDRVQRMEQFAITVVKALKLL